MIKISFNQDPVHTTAEWHLGNNKEDIVFTVVRHMLCTTFQHPDITQIFKW